jgi:hypothetical protein
VITPAKAKKHKATLYSLSLFYLLAKKSRPGFIVLGRPCTVSLKLSFLPLQTSSWHKRPLLVVAATAWPKLHD